MKPRIAIPVAADELANPNARRKYRTAIEQAGGDPVLVAPPQYLASVPDLLERFDGLLLPGGGDIDPELYGGREHPAVRPAQPGVDGFQIEAARAARRAAMPVLGICRGIQVMNVALGGTLYEDIEAQHDVRGGPRVRAEQTPDHARDETTHALEVTAGSKLANLLGTTSLAANSLHHQAVRVVAADLIPVAKTRDAIVEGVELQDGHPFYVGVQWHPEELVSHDEPSRSLFRGFVAHAAERAQRRTARSS